MNYKPNLSKEDWQPLKELTNDETIVVKEADNVCRYNEFCAVCTI